MTEAEAKAKLELIRQTMLKHGIEGLRFKGVDWFSWATCGGSSAVIFTSEVGVAEVFITPKQAWVLTNRIERDRLAEEEVPNEFEVVSFPWQESEAASNFVISRMNGKPCYSDRPTGSEKTLPFDFQILKMTLSSEEIERYRKIGRLAAEAMTEALQQARPDWSEDRLAGEGARALWRRGLDPALVMVGGEKRVPTYRHPIATTAPLEGCAMMVFCARAYGLYANLTRFVYFRDPTDQEVYNFERVAQVEAAAFEMSTRGRPLRELYQEIAHAYAHAGVPDQVDRHHQGGPTGYLSRETLATPGTPEHFKIENQMALAWNPSLPGAKIEDTVLTTERGIEILTVDPNWPTFEFMNRARPDVWIRK